MNHMKSVIRILCLALVLSATSACTTLKSTDDPALATSSDPLVGVNRRVYAFNAAADRAILKPAAEAYDAVLPGPAKQSVGNFFSNLREPLNVVNNILQGKVEGALHSTYRFAVNSTVGVLGLFDVASTYKVERRSEDFGQTLATWGVKPGPYIVLPFLGPTNFRDGLGRVIGVAAYFPINEISDSGIVRGGLNSLEAIDLRAFLLGSDEILNNQLDPYLFLKQAYEKNRLGLIYDGNPPEESDDDIDF